MTNRTFSRNLPIAGFENGHDWGLNHELSPLAMCERVLSKTLTIAGGLWMLSFALIFLLERDWLTSSTVELVLELILGPILAWTGRLVRRY